MLFKRTAATTKVDEVLLLSDDLLEELHGLGDHLVPGHELHEGSNHNITRRELLLLKQVKVR